MIRRPYLDWEHVFLDTSIVFAYMAALRPNNAHPKADFVKRVVDDLVTHPNRFKRKRQFYISAISIAEMYDKSTDQKKTAKIVKQLDIETLMFIPFDTDVAEHMTSGYHEILGTEKLNVLTRELSFMEHNLVLAREWLTKDLMILASADWAGADVVLTLDKKTMLPIAKKIGLFCAIVEEENFNYSQKYIFEYQEGFQPKKPENHTVAKPSVTEFAETTSLPVGQETEQQSKKESENG